MSNSATNSLQLKNVCHSFQSGRHSVIAVNDVSLSIASGDFVVIRGPSGSGKSTLLLITGGMMRPTSGKVVFNDHPVYAMGLGERTDWRKLNVGFVFQQIHLLPYLNVRDNIRMASGNLAEDTLELWLDRMKLANRASHYPAELSVGEQQRAALIRAIIGSPSLLLTDEPISHLDPESSTLVVSALDEYRHAGGAVMMVTHHFDPTKSMDSDIRFLTMAHGKLEPTEPQITST